MHWNIPVMWLFLYSTNLAAGYRQKLETKCKRDCNTEYGTIQCWNKTVNGFAYGLSTAMIDFCQVIVNVRNFTNDQEKWYKITHQAISNELEHYSLTDGSIQLTKADIERIAVSLINKCFNDSSSMNLYEPTCPLCSNAEVEDVRRWRLSSIILTVLSGLIICIISLLYALYVHYTDYLYKSIKA